MTGPLSLPWPEGAEAFALAGGLSTRMGRDKALVSIGGRTLISIALDKLRALPLAAPPRIAGWRMPLASPGDDAQVVEDLHPGCGPLGGIEAALGVTSQPLNLFLPVDLPLVPPQLLAWMLARATLTGALATYPRVSGRAQPLCAVYHRDLLGSIAHSLAGGEHKVTRALDATLVIQKIDSFDLELMSTTYPEMHSFSPAPWYWWFRNLNRPADLDGIERYLPREKML